MGTDTLLGFKFEETSLEHFIVGQKKKVKHMKNILSEKLIFQSRSWAQLFVVLLGKKFKNIFFLSALQTAPKHFHGLNPSKVGSAITHTHTPMTPITQPFTFP